jgi:hypothetical protein
MKRAIYDMGVVKKTKDDETFGAPEFSFSLIKS